MVKTTKNSNKQKLLTAVKILILPVILLSFMLSNACVSSCRGVTGHVDHNYTFSLQGTNLVWESRNTRDSDLSYLVYVRRDNTFRTASHTRVNSSINLTMLDLASGYNTVRVVSDHISQNTSCASYVTFCQLRWENCGSCGGVYLRSVGYWDIYVTINHTNYSYTFTRIDHRNFTFNGVHNFYRWTLYNTRTSTRVTGTTSNNSINLSQFNSYFISGTMRLYVSAVTSASYNNSRLGLSLVRSSHEFEA